MDRSLHCKRVDRADATVDNMANVEREGLSKSRWVSQVTRRLK
jgi:hypothetical protein